MAARYVVDTNVLVYALDRREPEKRERAREVLRRVGGAGTAALPAQVLSEFGGACLRKLEPRPDPRSGTAGGRAPHARLPGLAAHRPRGARSPAGRRGAHALLLTTPRVCVSFAFVRRPQPFRYLQLAAVLIDGLGQVLE